MMIPMNRLSALMALACVAVTAGLAGCNRQDVTPPVATAASDAAPMGGDGTLVADSTGTPLGQAVEPTGSTSGSMSQGTYGQVGGASAAGLPQTPEAAMNQEPTSAGQPASTAPLSTLDQQFAKAAAEAGLYEVAVARLAADKATDPAIKSMATMLVDDHTKAHGKLVQAVGQRATLPQDIPASKQQVIDRLSKTSGKEFDRQFLQTVGVGDHQADIQLFEKAQTQISDAALKNHIQTSLPVLKHHLESARELIRTQDQRTTQ